MPETEAKLTALEFAAELGERLRGRALWVQDHKSWYRCDDRGYWSRERLEGTLKDATDLAVEIAPGATSASIGAAVNLCRAFPGLPRTPDDFDRHPWLLGVDNGVVDLRTGALGGPRPDLLLTRRAPSPFDPLAPAPRWEENVLRLCDGVRERADLLRMAVGMALVGDGGAKEHGFVYLLGPAGNGKSALLRMLSGALGKGDYGHAAVMQPRDLTERDRHLAWMMKLRGARVAVLCDIPTERLSTAKLRDLAGGDPITANRMRGEDETWDPTHTLFVASNNPPAFGRNTQGMARRYRPIVTGASLGERMDAAFEERLVAEEGAGVLAWAVRGCLEWQRAGRKLPRLADMEAMAAAHISDSNPVDEWASACLDATGEAGDFVSRAEARQSYAAWRLDQSMGPAREADFIDLFNELRRMDGVREGRRKDPQAQGFRGARLRPAEGRRRY